MTATASCTCGRAYYADHEDFFEAQRIAKSRALDCAAQNPHTHPLEPEIDTFRRARRINDALLMEVGA